MDADPLLTPIPVCQVAPIPGTNWYRVSDPGLEPAAGWIVTYRAGYHLCDCPDARHEATCVHVQAVAAWLEERADR